MSHTPKPWLVSKHATPEHTPQFGIYSEDHPSDFAIVRGEDKARMIQAVPDMIAALEEISERGPVPGYGAPSALMLRLVGTQSIARAALNKVKGE